MHPMEFPSYFLIPFGNSTIHNAGYKDFLEKPINLLEF